MNITTGTDPVRYLIWDGFVTPRDEWTVAPATALEAWECQYSNDSERGKRTARSLSGWSANVLRQMCEIDVMRACAQLFGVPAFPDSLLWGGGLQVIAPGGHLVTHLDGSVHPQRPNLRRAIQMVCFCHPVWKPAFGGEFAFFSPNGNLVQKIEPIPGRLIAFENSDFAYHAVLPVSSIANDRITVATSLLADARSSDTRVRALFMPSR